MSHHPFVIHVDEAVLIDLHQRLEQTRWPDEIPQSGWDYGTNLSYLQRLVAYWRDGFDWRAQEQLLNAFPQFQARIDGVGIHFVHMPGKGPRPLPLLISHGWPGSFFEMYKIIRPLADPARYGGDAEDAFHVVVPSLPGFGFSDRPQQRGMDVARMAQLFLQLMTDELGYTQFGAQGGDWGSLISSQLGYAYPEKLIGIHLTMVPITSRPKADEITPEIHHWQEQVQQFQSEGSGYSHIQGTCPQTLAYGLNDSPVGLAAWIVEKFRAWSDCNGDLESTFTREELLTTIMMYWVTQTINSSTRLYYEMRHAHHPPRGRVEVPTGVAAFPKDIVIPPRALAEKDFHIQHWSTLDKGGHFAALEQPETLVKEIRTFFRPLR